VLKGMLNRVSIAQIDKLTHEWTYD